MKSDAITPKYNLDSKNIKDRGPTSASISKCCGSDSLRLSKVASINACRKPWSPAGQPDPGWIQYREESSLSTPSKDQNDQGEDIQASSRNGTLFQTKRTEQKLLFPRNIIPESMIKFPWRLSLSKISSRTQKTLLRQKPKQAAQIKCLLASGIQTFSLRSLGLTTLHGFGIHSEVKKVYLQQNFLSSFEGWESQPMLEELSIEDNLIESFRGACEQRLLEELRIRGNPVFDARYHRIMALIAFGKTSMHCGIRSIDGEAIKKTELEIAMSLSKVVTDAIRAGWILDTVPNPSAGSVALSKLSDDFDGRVQLTEPLLASDLDMTIDQFLHFQQYCINNRFPGSERNFLDQNFSQLVSSSDEYQRKSSLAQINRVLLNDLRKHLPLSTKLPNQIQRGESLMLDDARTHLPLSTTNTSDQNPYEPSNLAPNTSIDSEGQAAKIHKSEGDDGNTLDTASNLPIMDAESMHHLHTRGINDLESKIEEGSELVLSDENLRSDSHASVQEYFHFQDIKPEEEGGHRMCTDAQMCDNSEPASGFSASSEAIYIRKHYDAETAISASQTYQCTTGLDTNRESDLTASGNIMGGQNDQLNEETEGSLSDHKLQFCIQNSNETPQRAQKRFSARSLHVNTGSSSRTEIHGQYEELKFYDDCLERAYQVVKDTPFWRKTILSPTTMRSAHYERSLEAIEDPSDGEEMDVNDDKFLALRCDHVKKVNEYEDAREESSERDKGYWQTLEKRQISHDVVGGSKVSTSAAPLKAIVYFGVKDEIVTDMQTYRHSNEDDIEYLKGEKAEQFCNDNQKGDVDISRSNIKGANDNAEVSDSKAKVPPGEDEEKSVSKSPSRAPQASIFPPTENQFCDYEDFVPATSREVVQKQNQPEEYASHMQSTDEVAFSDAYPLALKNGDTRITVTSAKLNDSRTVERCSFDLKRPEAVLDANEKTCFDPCGILEEVQSVEPDSSAYADLKGNPTKIWPTKSEATNEKSTKPSQSGEHCDRVKNVQTMVLPRAGKKKKKAAPVSIERALDSERTASPLSKCDASSRPSLLSGCELRGTSVVGSKLTSFAKRIKKKDQISCSFEWFRVNDQGQEEILEGNCASHVIMNEDVGYRIKVLVKPLSQEHGAGESVFAVSECIEPLQLDDKDHLPHLLDWKIQINTDREYLEPIKIHYVYAGGIEGLTRVFWFRESLAEPETFEPIQKDCGTYQPYVGDQGRRIKIVIVPVRADGVAGASYSYVIDKLEIPHDLELDVHSFERMLASGSKVVVRLNCIMSCDIERKTICCCEHSMEVHNEHDILEARFPLASGNLEVQAMPDLPRQFKILGRECKAAPLSGDRRVAYQFEADQARTRDVIVLFLQRVARPNEYQKQMNE